ncbi:MAG: hypothetical protein IKX34_04290 [Bacteroidales bacterium]|nr:hypothetical protein [Bacteroidales bacterium]
MKKQILAAALVLLIFAPVVSAQSLRGSYFFETSLQRSKLNAAFAPQNNFYVSIPLLGSISNDACSNIGLGNFLFPNGNTPYTFMHENVPAETFLGKLPETDPYLRTRTELDLLGGGFRVGQYGFATVAVSTAVESETILPNEFLRFAKTAESGSYPGPKVKANSYGILSLGYSHDLSVLVEGLRIGGRVKLLGGLYAGDLDFCQMTVHLPGDDTAEEPNGHVVLMRTDNLTVSTDGSCYLAGLKWADKKIRPVEGKGFNGFGVAVDFGIEYRLQLDGFINGVIFSASVNNLGTMRYNRNVSLLLTGATASYTGFTGINADYDFKTNFNQVVDDFSRLANVSSNPTESYRPFLTPSYYAGLEVPFFQEMFSAGVLYYKAMGFDNLMVSANVTPMPWLNIGLNGSFLGAANTYGFYAEFIPKKWVGVFCGMDIASLKTNRNHIPIDNCTRSACLGINFVW